MTISDYFSSPVLKKLKEDDDKLIKKMAKKYGVKPENLRVQAASGALRPAARVNKYQNIKTEIDGVTFDSKAEAAYYQELKLLLKSGQIQDFEMQVSFILPREESLPPASQTLMKRYKKLRSRYIADFVIHHNNGSKEVIDVKGVVINIFVFKWKLMQIFYPEYEYTLIKNGKRVKLPYENMVK